MTTIFASSTGAPPAAIAIVRISGPQAFSAARRLAGSIPPAREARMRALRDPENGELLDRALILAFPAPATATGEDLIELHLHGGRAVVAAVETALAQLPDMRRAEPGEFTRRALANGRIDLAEAEGLGDLLTAETQLQRRAALQQAGGTLSRRIADWRSRLIELAAKLEAAMDFADEADIPEPVIEHIQSAARGIAGEISRTLSAPTVERLRDGIRVVIAGPPNSGKSTLFNALVKREAAIVSSIAGTTRDRLDAAVAFEGMPFVVTDTAGLRKETDDSIERIGIERAEVAILDADVVLWLGDTAPPERAMLWLHARADAPGREMSTPGTILAVAARDADSVDAVWRLILRTSTSLIPQASDMALNSRQSAHCRDALSALHDVEVDDELIVAEAIRRAHQALARVTGDSGVEAVLDALFAKFCIGK